MTPTSLLNALNEIDNAYILSAGERLGRLPLQSGQTVRRRFSPRLALLAAALLALLLTACTAVYLSLEKRLTPSQFPELHQVQPLPGETDTAPGTGGYLSSFRGGDSPVARAEAAWADYFWSYNREKDEAWRAAHGDDGSSWRGDYSWYGEDEELKAISRFYGVYNQEMADKLFEIRDTYGVKLHTALTVPLHVEDLYRVAGTGTFFLAEESGSLTPFFVTEDGSFICEGGLSLADGLACSFRLERNSPDTMDFGTRYIYAPEVYEQWEYTTSQGAAVSIAYAGGQDPLYQGQALVFYDTEAWGVTLVLTFDGPADRETVQMAVGCFDYQALATGGDGVRAFIDAGPTVSSTGQAISPADFLSSPEYLAAEAFSRRYTAWYKGENPKYAPIAANFPFYLGFPSGQEEPDALAEELCETYGLTPAAGSNYILHGQRIQPENVDPMDGILPGDTEDISVPEIYALLGTENFISGAEPWRVAAYDNGAFLLEFPMANSTWTVHYMPKGALYTGLRLSMAPPADMPAWNYDTAWGGTVSIATDDTTGICDTKGDTYIFYETENAYIMITGVLREPRALEACADCVDLSKLK